MSQAKEKCDPASICFGFDRQTDERSLRDFLLCFGQDDLLSQLIPRLTTEEIEGAVDFLTALMSRHFSEGEYHKYFLGRKE